MEIPQVFKDKPWLLWGGAGAVLGLFVFLRRRSSGPAATVPAPAPSSALPGPSPGSGSPSSGGSGSSLSQMLASFMTHSQETQASFMTQQLQQDRAQYSQMMNLLSQSGSDNRKALSESMQATASVLTRVIQTSSGRPPAGAENEKAARDVLGLKTGQWYSTNNLFYRVGTPDRAYNREEALAGGYGK